MSKLLPAGERIRQFFLSFRDAAEVQRPHKFGNMDRSPGVSLVASTEKKSRA